MRYFLGEIAAKLSKRMEKFLYILRPKVEGNSNTAEIGLVRASTQWLSLLSTVIMFTKVYPQLFSPWIFHPYTMYDHDNTVWYFFPGSRAPQAEIKVYACVGGR